MLLSLIVALSQHPTGVSRDLALANSSVIAIARLTDEQGEILVERTVAGDLAPGRHKVRMNVRFVSASGKLVSRGSVITEGSVDVRKPALWFLSLRTEVETPAARLWLDSNANVLDAGLENYFRILRDEPLMAAFQKVFASENRVWLARALRLMNRDSEVWPFHRAQMSWTRDSPLDYLRWRRPPILHVEGLGNSILSLAESRDPGVRQLGAAYYCALEGKRNLPSVRGLLANHDPTVRSIAAKYLTEWCDYESIDGVAATLPILNEIDKTEIGHVVALDLLDHVERVADLRFVPGLIKLLTPPPPPEPGEARIPIRAQWALFAITGFKFPLDVSKSLRAWEGVCGFPTKSERLLQLRRLLGS